MKQKSIEMKCISNILRVLIHDICFSFSLHVRFNHAFLSCAFEERKANNRDYLKTSLRKYITSKVCLKRLSYYFVRSRDVKRCLGWSMIDMFLIEWVISKHDQQMTDRG